MIFGETFASRRRINYNFYKNRQIRTRELEKNKKKIRTRVYNCLTMKTVNTEPFVRIRKNAIITDTGWLKYGTIRTYLRTIVHTFVKDLAKVTFTRMSTKGRYIL